MTGDIHRSVDSSLRGRARPRKLVSGTAKVVIGAAARILLGAACLGLLVALVAQLTAPGFTRLTLADPDTGRQIAAATVRDGAPITLTWHNSLFDLDVVEDFVTENGVLVQTGVTFADPRGLAPPTVPASQVDDYYHTGGPFSAKGLRRPFTQIMYRVGEIGNPRLTVGARSIAFKAEVGFGGRIVLSTRGVRWWERAFARMGVCAI